MPHPIYRISSSTNGSPSLSSLASRFIPANRSVLIALRFMCVELTSGQWEVCRDEPLRWGFFEVPFWSLVAAGRRWILMGRAGSISCCPPSKRAIDGHYHALKQAKYARRCLAEAAYRFNWRFQLRSMLQRLVHAMIFCKPCAEPKLSVASNFLG